MTTITDLIQLDLQFVTASGNNAWRWYDHRQGSWQSLPSNFGIVLPVNMTLPFQLYITNATQNARSLDATINGLNSSNLSGTNNTTGLWNFGADDDLFKLPDPQISYGTWAPSGIFYVYSIQAGGSDPTFTIKWPPPTR